MDAKHPVRQHYIPEFLMRNFVDSCGHLWVYDKKRGKLYSTNAKNVFVKNNIYTRYEFGRGRNDYEKFVRSTRKDYSYEADSLARIESRAAPVVSRIIKHARAKLPPQLSACQASDWKVFVLAMARRTPESRQRVTSISDREAFYLAAKTRAEEINYDLPDMDTLYEDSRIWKLEDMVISNVHAAFAAGVSPREKREEERFCRECGLCVAIICNPSPVNSFLIGSHGVAIVPSGKAKGGWLPVAHDVAVSVTPFPDRELLVVVDDKAEHVVEAINAATDALSHTIASRSGELVRAFIVR